MAVFYQLICGNSTAFTMFSMVTGELCGRAGTKKGPRRVRFEIYPGTSIFRQAKAAEG
ncbi:MAG: hypothetical protein NDI77_09300 [Geobacteraceae bacterium]|nr:hypothetical protein [Geobacteraceae bacterium]